MPDPRVEHQLSKMRRDLGRLGNRADRGTPVSPSPPSIENMVDGQEIDYFDSGVLTRYKKVGNTLYKMTWTKVG